jgi:hypothetical protein
MELGCISNTGQKGRQFWVAAAERGDAGRFIVRADEKLTAFLELGSATRACGRFDFVRFFTLRVTTTF